MKKIKLSDIIKPKRVDVEGETGDSRYGKFIAEPLERGFALTIGNALRRVLLSTLEGSAITSVRIDGVLHEFSSVPGVVEDVTEIVLNLKEIVVDLQDKDTAVLHLSKSGSGDILASDLGGDPAVRIINPEAKIATLSKNGKLDLEVTVKRGRGYVTADRNKLEGVPEGTIFIDSIFSPIRRVNLNVTDARVGQRTDYDKLILEIWSNGSIDPRVAVAQAASILYDQLALFVGEDLIDVEQEAAPEEPKSQLNENLYRRIDELELTVRSANCLENANIKYIAELVQKSEGEMLRTKNFGRKSLNEIKDILVKMGLTLGMDIGTMPSREELDQISREAATEQF